MATTCGGCSRLVAGASLAGLRSSTLRRRQPERLEGVGCQAKPSRRGPPSWDKTKIGSASWLRSTMSSSSAEARAATPPPSTAPPPGSTSPWSRRTRSAAPACTGAASRPRSCSRPPHVFRTVAEAERVRRRRPTSPTLDFGATMARKSQGRRPACSRACSGLLKNRKVTIVRRHRHPRPADHTVTVTGADGEHAPSSPATHVILAAGLGAADDPRLRRRRRRRAHLRRGVRADRRCPARVAVIGGGAIGCEFASMLSDLGSEVTVLEALPQILPGVDKDVVDRRPALVQEAGASTSAPA